MVPELETPAFKKTLLHIIMVVFACHFGMLKNSVSAQDTVYAIEISSLPVFDGCNDDPCWASAEWQSIDNVWMPYGDALDSSDLYGRFKVLWSGEDGLLYFFIEITDDVYSGGYIPGGVTAEIFNFDMFEIFIDADKSGGYHVLDSGGTQDIYPGNNAENAFAYHVFTGMPAQGNTHADFVAEDIGGVWKRVSYISHFPDFFTRFSGNKRTHEFSLFVYDDTYSEQSADNSIVVLSPGKVLGLTVAINDDDDPDISPEEARRDHFVGSVAVETAAWNDHWMNADDFGILKLVPAKWNEPDLGTENNK